MGTSISLLIFFLPYIFLSSVDLFGENLRVYAITPLIQKACDSSNIPKFCYDILGNDPVAQFASTKFNLEDTTIQMAYSNYTNIHRKVLIITSNETNPEFKQVYRKCLHEYVLLKSYFEDLINILLFESYRYVRTVKEAAEHVTICMVYFYNSPNIPNPFAQDNDNLLSFFDLLRSMHYNL
ncbi:hypothetical protein H5410_044258 [Solanum commersonii]|uniref:Pectinesterase inhibitor domain-containing protein n=1 Tax=Solanum commersonii TaxID=4109 RepID=A0A9J5XAC1_SOLCO|nr:hypothetical protein H5410_044258 [Solanum commersonii]